ncbi:MULTISPECIES: hypothetical protein [Rhizobium/Agrobacterium group]|uniref:hypothetical protein n=1 Tax=Rhizobium/Agrobacterium group TaxID=227290 RepID=UPI001573043E|nr:MULTISPECIES: hypothetical protein [Rhizobium/Agrobacterium group]MDH7802271.1 hypothetical protein [Rhizobium sp. AN70]NTB05068.1 hypothetical protein [Agrobacterium tumefaciens]
MNKVSSIAPFLQFVCRVAKSQIVKDVSALWAVACFILGMIYFSQVATALVLIVREVR